MTPAKANGPAPAGAPRDLTRESKRSDQVRSLQLPAQTSTRPVFSAGLAWSLLAAVLLIGGLLTYRNWNRTAPEELAASEEAGNGAPAAAPAAGADMGGIADETEIALESRGYVIPAHQILVSPEVSGRLVQLTAEEGMQVEQGDLLAEIDTTEYKLDVQRAEASVEAAKQRLLELERGLRPEEVAQVEAELRESQAQLAQLESQFKRSSQLRRDNAVPVDKLEQDESAYFAMQRRVERLKLAVDLAHKGPRKERVMAAQADLAQAEAELAKAQWRLNKCTIVAPISGTILRKNAEEGNLVNPIAFNGSYSICEMADLSDLEVELDIQERDIRRVFPGQQCRIRAEAYPDRSYQGVVSRLLPIADRAKGAVPVRVKLAMPADERGIYLKPEMAATVTFLNREVDKQTAVRLESSTPAPIP